MILFFGIPAFFVLLLVFIVAIISGASTRVCPHCAERIKKSASVCRYCGRDVASIAPPPPMLPPLDPGAPKPSRWPQAILAIILIGTVGAVFYSH